MSKADQDAAKWQEMNARNQARNLIKAKEQGDAYYINSSVKLLSPKKENQQSLLQGMSFAEKLHLERIKLAHNANNVVKS